MLLNLFLTLAVWAQPIHIDIFKSWCFTQVDSTCVNPKGPKLQHAPADLRAERNTSSKYEDILDHPPALQLPVVSLEACE